MGVFVQAGGSDKFHTLSTKGDRVSLIVSELLGGQVITEREASGYTFRQISQRQSNNSYCHQAVEELPQTIGDGMLDMKNQIYLVISKDLVPRAPKPFGPPSDEPSP